VGIKYPGTPPGTAFDTDFGVPSEPEATPLSESGTSTRDHPQLHEDINLAVMALEQNATLASHDHSGDPTHVGMGGKLAQANTHQNADTDSAPSALHHTIGPGANQAAAGNHTHAATALPAAPFVSCTSLSRPATPFLGMLIFETDTNFLRAWCTSGGVTSWHIVPVTVPICRLAANVDQALTQGGTIINFQSVLEDNNHFTTSGNLTDVTIHDAGLYHIDAAVQWNTNQIPDSCWIVLTVNGYETHLRDQKFQRGETFTPGFSQTIHLSGKWRFAAGDVLRVKVDFLASTGILGSIFLFFEQLVGQQPHSQITSRMECCYLAP